MFEHGNVLSKNERWKDKNTSNNSRFVCINELFSNHNKWEKVVYIFKGN